ncbi:MAG: FkbM family methyltransferase [Fulvivirga sp.]|uniref:FkbM family methyltransferase n=1 Tax=Fulvivirga sp. TaxID=1931237 RepID=UPI0032ED44B3
MKELLRKIIYRSDFLFYLVNRVFRRPSYPSLDHFLLKYALSRREVRFVQIGANDGLNNDPIYKYVRMFRWHGKLIEPQPDVFKQLKRNYFDNRNLIFLNVAVGSSEHQIKIYRFSFSQSRWLNGWATFDKEKLKEVFDNSEYLRNRAAKEDIQIPHNFDEAVEELNVPVLSFEEVLDSWKTIDILVLDVEGYEFHLFQEIDFKKYSIELILFEHRHMDSETQRLVESLLMTNGYEIIRFEHDSIAITRNHDLILYGK